MDYIKEIYDGLTDVYPSSVFFSHEELILLDKDMDKLEVVLSEEYDETLEAFKTTYEECITLNKLIINSDEFTEEGFMDTIRESLVKFGKKVAELIRRFIQFIKTMAKKVIVGLKKMSQKVKTQMKKVRISDIKIRISELPNGWEIMWYTEDGLPLDFPSPERLNLLVSIFNRLTPGNILGDVGQKYNLDSEKMRIAQHIQDSMSVLQTITNFIQIDDTTVAVLDQRKTTLQDDTVKLQEWLKTFRGDVDAYCGTYLAQAINQKDVASMDFRNIYGIFDSILFGKKDVTMNSEALNPVQLIMESGTPNMDNLNKLIQGEGAIKYIEKMTDEFIKSSNKTTSNFIKYLQTEERYLNNIMNKRLDELFKMEKNTGILRSESSRNLHSETNIIIKNLLTFTNMYINTAQELEGAYFKMINYLMKLTDVTANIYISIDDALKNKK